MKRLLFFMILFVPVLSGAQPCTLNGTVTGPQTCSPGTLTLTITGAQGPVSIQWMTQPQNSTPWAPIVGATSTTYNISPFSPAANYFAALTDSVCSIYSNSFSFGIPGPSVNVNSYYCQGTGTIPITTTGTNVLWYTSPTSAGTPTAPVVNLAVPGSFTYYVTQTIGTCTSQMIPVQWSVGPPPPPATVTTNSPICTGDTMVLDFAASCMFCNISITGPGGPVAGPHVVVYNAGAADAGWYYFVANQSGCMSSVDSTLVVVGSCQDSVWPGDANYDLITDNNDALYIAQYLNTPGYTRTNATINYVAQPAVDWGVSGTTNADLKHADCNGDGLVDLGDNNAVTLNYGIVHPKGQHVPKPKVTGIPDLYFDLTGISFTPGTTVSVPVKLGNSASPMNNFFGMAAQVKVNGITLTQPMSFTNSTSWLGNSSNTMVFEKAVNNGQLDMAYARTDHHNVNGSGTIGNVLIPIPANSSGQMTLYFDNVTIIDSTGNVTTNYNVVDDTVQVIALGISNTTLPMYEARIVPNPSATNTSLQIVLGSDATVYYSIMDVAGRLVNKGTQSLASGKQSIPLATESLPAGVYQIHLYTPQWPSGTNVKFVKQ